MATVTAERSGIASAVLNTTRQAAGTVGVDVFGTMAAGRSGNIVMAISQISIGGAIYMQICCFIVLRMMEETLRP